ncbi:MAG: MucR family transcriptional regulator [Magnetococcales bacterium]|nr:MucR family transcriptional regulator [Magnetococcales bacterium]
MVAEWHPTKNGEITPFNVSCYSTEYSWWRCTAAGHEWQTRIAVRSRGKSCPYCRLRKVTFQTSFAGRYPELAKEWHPTRNGEVMPASIFPYSNTKAWWSCDIGHEWQPTLRTRISGSQCPYCQKLLETPERSIAHTHPHLAREWHSEKNGRLTPDKVSHGSNRCVFWLCELGHTWKSSVEKRSRGIGCPYCAGRRLGQGNSLQARYPHIAREWHPTRNVPLTPEDVVPGSNRAVWWSCDRGHQWRRKVARQVHGRGCPYCLGYLVTPEISFGASFPEQAKEWLQEKNGEWTPFNVSCYSSKRVWWRCSRRHEWQTQVSHRRRSGCPYCSGRYRTPETSVTCFAPELARQWHPDKNGARSSDDISQGSSRKIWWLCPCGHEWFSTVRNRLRNGKCPMCHAIPEPVSSPSMLEQESPMAGQELAQPLIFLDPMPDSVQIHSQPMPTSDGDETLTCLICGIQFPSLNWHLRATHQMSGDAYRRQFSLPADFPLNIASGKPKPPYMQTDVCI